MKFDVCPGRLLHKAVVVVVVVFVLIWRPTPAKNLKFVGVRFVGLGSDLERFIRPNNFNLSVKTQLIFRCKIQSSG